MLHFLLSCEFSKYVGIEKIKTTSMEKESTVVIGKNKALFETWK